MWVGVGEMIKDEIGSSRLELGNNFESKVKGREGHGRCNFLSRRIPRSDSCFTPRVEFYPDY